MAAICLPVVISVFCAMMKMFSVFCAMMKMYSNSSTISCS